MRATDAALEQARWLQQRRGLAYVELDCGHCLQAMNVADSNLAVLREAELLQPAGRLTRPAALERFDRRWPAEALPITCASDARQCSAASN